MLAKNSDFALFAELAWRLDALSSFLSIA